LEREETVKALVCTRTDRTTDMGELRSHTQPVNERSLTLTCGVKLATCRVVAQCHAYASAFFSSICSQMNFFAGHTCLRCADGAKSFSGHAHSGKGVVADCLLQ